MNRGVWRLELATVELDFSDIWLELSKSLNSFTDLDDLAKLMGVPPSLLRHRAFIAYRPNFYNTLSAPKRDGTLRQISAPDWRMKFLQSRLLPLLEELYRPSSRVHGFVKGKSILSNANAHIGKRIILNFDLQNFFPTITFRRIRGRLMAKPYSLSNQVATAIARLCTLDDILPVGAPTSPMLANMVCSKLDYDLRKLSKDHGCFYTRYADDITISTNRRRLPIALVDLSPGQAGGSAVIGDAIRTLIEEHGFAVNPAKTRVLGKSESQQVTGILCNEKPNPLRKFRRSLRGALNAWETHGRHAAEETFREKYNFRGAQSLENSLRGKIEHLKFVRGTDDLVVKKLVDRFNLLPNRSGKKIDYLYVGGWRENIYRTVFIVEAGDDDAMIWKQGTCFSIGDRLLLTNAHNIEIDGAICHDPKVRFSVGCAIVHDAEVVHVDSKIDLALLKMKSSDFVEEFVTTKLSLASSDPKSGDQVTVVGFPQYILGDEHIATTGVITNFSDEHGERVFAANVPIIKGNSGGPVLDHHGEVIGIATRGGSEDDLKALFKNASVPVSTIKAFIDAAKSKLANQTIPNLFSNLESP